MKKFGLIAFLSVLTLGLVACGGNDKSTGVNPSTSGNTSTSNSQNSTGNTSTSDKNSSTGGNVSTGDKNSSTGGAVDVQLPVAWGENATFQASECSVSLVPGSIDNPNAVSLQNFLHLEGARYIDLRDVSEGYGETHIANFESISYFKVIEGLFTRDGTSFTPKYEESEFILNRMFPKDMTYFVMCQVGGRVVHFMNLLNQYEYNMDNVYNIGGWNQIKDKENYAGYDVSLGVKASSIEYDFASLTPVEAEPVAANNEVKQVRRAALPVAWGENATFQAKECTISLVPGSIENPDAKKVADYLTTEGIRYIDLRDVSEGYGETHIANFESISYFKVVEGLFTRDGTTFTPKYEESEFILNRMFPKDMTYFVMCQVGGRVVHFMNLLNQYGYNMDNVYNIGGWNQIKDKENYAGYDVSLGVKASSIEYDFASLTLVEAE